MFGVQGLFAEHERAKIMARMAAGRDAKRKDGRWYAGKVPYGYRYERLCGHGVDIDDCRMCMGKKQNVVSGRFVVVEKEAAVYRRVVAMYLDEGLGVWPIAERLKEDGVVCRRRPFGGRVISRMLKNTAYYGHMVQNRFVYKNGRATKQLKPRDQWMTYTLPPIIPKTVWDRVQAKMASNRTKTKRASRLEEFWLRDALRCGRCGSPIKGRTYYSTRYYACRNRCMSKAELNSRGWEKCGLPYIPAADLERAVWWDILNMLTLGANKGKMAAAVEPDKRWKSKIKKLTENVAKQTRLLNGKQNQRDGLFAMLDAGQLSDAERDEFLMRLRRNQGELITLRGRLEEAQEALAAAQTAQEENGLYRDFVQNKKAVLDEMARALEQLTPPDKKRLVDSMIDGPIIVDGDGGGKKRRWAIRPHSKPRRVNLKTLRRFVDEGKLGKRFSVYVLNQIVRVLKPFWVIIF